MTDVGWNLAQTPAPAEPAAPTNAAASLPGATMASMSLDRRIEVDSVQFLYRATPAIVANLSCGVLFFLTAYPYVAALHNWLWLSMVIISCLARFGLKATFDRHEINSDNARRWGIYFAIGAASSGLVWTAAVVLALQANSVILCAIIAVIVAGLVAGAATAASAFLPSYYAFSVGPIGALSGILIFSNEREYMLLGLMTLLFGFFVARIAHRTNASLRHSLQLRHTNGELIAELQDALDKVKRSNRAKSDFLANMSHELRTPLNAIIGFSGMIMSEALGPIGSPRYKEYARDIQESGSHLLGLISNILDVSKIEAGQVNLQTEEIEIDDVINACVSIIRDRARSARIAVAVDIQDDLPILIADETKLKQVLINLLTNAVKFTPAGGSVTISVSCSEATGYCIKIEDTGIGMAPEDIPRALVAFHQVANKTPHANEGTGLGLTLAKSLVELHGGRLDMASAVDVGTTVTILFPLSTVIAASHHPRALTA